VKFDIGDFYENLLGENKFVQNPTKISITLRQEQSILLLPAILNRCENSAVD